MKSRRYTKKGPGRMRVNGPGRWIEERNRKGELTLRYRVYRLSDAYATRYGS